MGLMNYRYSSQVKGYAEPVDGSPGVAHAVGPTFEEWIVCGMRPPGARWHSVRSP